jgi:putative MATE family efflux protein
LRIFSLRHRQDPKILAIAVPALGSLAIDPLVSLVDTAFVGRLGPAPLGALGINVSLFAMAFLVFNFLAYGTTPRVANHLGRGDRDGAGRVVVQALSLAIIAGILATALLVVFARPILAMMGATGELEAPALTYLQIRAMAGPAVLLVTAAHGAFRGYQDLRTPLTVTIGINVVNVVLDWVFIFGLGWGIAGAAWATVIAQWAGALVFLWLLMRSRREAMGIALYVPRLEEMLPFLRVGGHLLIRTGALVGTMTLSTAVAARVGVGAVAAHHVALQIWGFLALVIDAFAIAAQTLVARHVGAGEHDETREVGNRLLVWGLVIGALLGLVFWLLSPVLPRLFTDDPETIATVHGIFLFVVLLQPLNGLVFVWDGIYMGTESFRYLAIAMVFSAAIAATVLLLTTPLGWGLAGVWWGLTALMGARALTLAVPWSLKR